jgi:hypothetical protein
MRQVTQLWAKESALCSSGLDAKGREVKGTRTWLGGFRPHAASGRTMVESDVEPVDQSLTYAATVLTGHDWRRCRETGQGRITVEPLA